MNIKNITFLHVYQTLITKLYKMFVMTFIGRFKLRVKDKNILGCFLFENTFIGVRNIIF